MEGIWRDLLNADLRGPDVLDSARSQQLDRLLVEGVGIQGHRKHRTIGSWRLEPRAMDSGPTWEDYLAENTALPGDHRRIRIYLSERSANKQQRESTQRAARREYLVLQGIDHPGIAKAENISYEHDAGPAIVFSHRPEWLRLDHFMARYGDRLDVDTRLGMVRQLAEALDHAHRRHLYHRSLAARSIYVAFEGEGDRPRLRICDWQAGSKALEAYHPEQVSTATMSASPRSLAPHVEGSASAYLAPEFARPEAESIPLDVFGLGAVGYLILTGEAPAEDQSSLQQRLAKERGLVPSTVADSITATMDTLIRHATAPEVDLRTESVREFLEELDAVEDELTAPDEEPVADPLTATAGTVVGPYQVVSVLGSGSTARALLVRRRSDAGARNASGAGSGDDARADAVPEQVVLKVALNDAGAERLHREAELLGRLRDSKIVQLLDGPLLLGGRTVLVTEYAGETSLARRLRQHGRLGIDELEAFGRQLFDVVEYLEGELVRHRDLKPDNLAVRRLANNQQRLVLFDFSLAGVPDSVIRAGTQYYLDPFLGTDRRPMYDNAAEHYAVAVTLHEMASADLPSWGDGLTEPHLLDPSEQTPQLAEDRFDPGLREGLVAFFRKAMHRDVTKRYDDLKQMRAAWEDVFKQLDRAYPPSTPLTTDDEGIDVQAVRDELARNANRDTRLVEAGLTPRALSVAEQYLGVSTVGELIVLPASRIQRLRGVGVKPRNELVRRAREWRARFRVEESVREAARDERRAEAAASGRTPVNTEERVRRLSLDEVVSRLLGKASGSERRVLELVLAVPGDGGTAAPVEPWAVQRVVAEQLGLTAGRVAQVLMASRERWSADSAVKWLRADLVEILSENGRVMEVSELATALLARRGSALDGVAQRLSLGAAAARAAIETEEKQRDPRLVKRRSGDRVLVALCADDDPSLPSDNDLLDYALRLGTRADQLVRLSPLPGSVEVYAELRRVAPPDGMRPLPETRLVALAAAASVNAAVTARLELYPKDLPPARAVRMAQVATVLGERGVTPEELRSRVLARFPDLTAFPEDSKEIRKVLREADLDVTWSEGRLVLSTSAVGGAWSVSRPTPPVPRPGGRLTTDQVTRRLRACAEEGGFLAVRAHLMGLPGVLAGLRAYEGAVLVDVAAEFVTSLRTVVREREKPRWETVLGADPATAPPVFRQLIGQAFERLEQRVRAVEGVAVLHDATPLAHYTDGPDVLARLAEAARSPRTGPNGLWLVCPMRDPHRPPMLDELAVPYLTDNETIELPRGFGAAGAGTTATGGPAA